MPDQTEFVRATTAPLLVENELRNLTEVVPAVGLSSYDDCAGCAKIIYARELTNDESQVVEESLALHVSPDPIVNYIELVGSTATDVPAIVTHDGSQFRLRTSNTLLYDSIFHQFNDANGVSRFRIENPGPDNLGSHFICALPLGEVMLDARNSWANPTNINFYPKGTGHLQVNGVNVPTVNELSKGEFHIPLFTLATAVPIT